jgi:hypothetical protein
MNKSEFQCNTRGTRFLAALCFGGCLAGAGLFGGLVWADQGATASAPSTEARAAATQEAQSVVTGVVHKVVPEEREIYVKTPDGKKFEYYFNPQTTVTRGEETLGFEELKQGMNVVVSARKIGRRLDPVNVAIK